jgi:hypothetical protein
MPNQFGRGRERGFTQLYRHATMRDALKYVGKPGEMTYNPCDKSIIIHNGCTPGGCMTLHEVILPPPPPTLCEAISSLPHVVIAC